MSKRVQSLCCRRLKATTPTALMLFLLGGVLAQLTNAQEVQKKRTPAQVAKQFKTAGWEFGVGWKPVTDPEEAKAWGQGLQKAMENADTPEISKFIDFGPVMNRCIAGISNPKFRAGFKEGVDQGMGSLLRQLSAEDSTYRFRGVKDTEYGPAPLFRMLDANGACNYHLWRLQTNSQGEVRGVDIYVFLTGESFGDTVRRLAVLSAPQNDPTFLQKLTGTEAAMTKNQTAMLEFMQAHRGQDFQKALTIYKDFPNNLKNEKAIMVIRVMASAQVNDDEYVAALKDFQSEFPDDSSADLAGIDLYFLKKQYDKMHESIDRLEAAVGKDAHLCMLRAIALSHEDKMAEAQESLENAINIEPDLEAPHWTLVEIGLDRKNFDLVNDTLKKLVKRFGYDSFDFVGNEAYAEYVKSEQHTAFVEFLKTIKK